MKAIGLVVYAIGYTVCFLLLACIGVGITLASLATGTPRKVYWSRVME